VTYIHLLGAISTANLLCEMLKLFLGMLPGAKTTLYMFPIVPKELTADLMCETPVYVSERVMESKQLDCHSLIAIPEQVMYQ
jgi:hypothetical protein